MKTEARHWTGFLTAMRNESTLLVLWHNSWNCAKWIGFLTARPNPNGMQLGLVS